MPFSRQNILICLFLTYKIVKNAQRVQVHIRVSKQLHKKGKKRKIPFMERQPSQTTWRLVPGRRPKMDV